jgi:hypothetical protein
MTNKITLTFLIVLMVSLFSSTDALAVVQNPDTENAIPQGGRLTYGVLTAIGLNRFIIQTNSGGAFDYQVDSGTRFRIKGLEDPTFSDLEIGMHLAVAARILDNNRVARLVVVIPDDFDPSLRFGVRVCGEILSVDLDTCTLTLGKPSGEEIAFQVHERTRFFGKSHDLDDLQVGWRATIAGRRDEEGLFHAGVVVTWERPRRITIAGEVNNVELEAGTFVIHTRRDRKVTIQVDGDTVFNSRGGVVQGLVDLQNGMVAVATGYHQGDGIILAKRVLAGSKEDLPDFEIKAGGKIVVVGLDFFTLQPRDGEEITFYVDTDTRFRGRGIRVRGISDLNVGMITLVGGVTGSDGEAIARSVLVIKGSRQATEQ